MDRWEYFFTAICSIRFHPRNIDRSVDSIYLRSEVELAAKVADLMEERANERMGRDSRRGT